MKQEDKELLLKDLCCRLPYGVKCKHKFSDYKEVLDGIKYENSFCYFIDCEPCLIDDVKPYLFPISSMTEEQKEDLLLTVVGEDGLKLFSVTKDGIISNDEEEQSLENFCFNNINFSNETTESYIDWLNKNNFDYRGLIKKSLALDATNLGIY